MTREEQLDWLCRLRSEIYVYMPKEWLIPMNDALDMSIKALEQEPFGMRDATKEERESVNDYIKSISKPTGINFYDAEPCEDAISRELLKSSIHNFFYGLCHVVTEEDIQAYIDAIPIVTPKEPINHELFRKALKHRLYERYMDNPSEFKALCGLIDDVESVVKHNAEVLARMEK